MGLKKKLSVLSNSFDMVLFQQAWFEKNAYFQESCKVIHFFAEYFEAEKLQIMMTQLYVEHMAYSLVLEKTSVFCLFGF